MNQELCGIINVYKEKGYTSHDVVAIVRKSLGRIKTGHTGTLDPAAMGVLPICIGKATKVSEYLASEIKGYRAVLNLGFTTDTQDDTGEVLSRFDVNLTKEEIENAIMSFKGDIEQIPPMYSAIKINGQKLYDLARQGKVVERKSRKITIHNIDILEFLPENKVKIDVLCSKGTYIRTLCHDIGEKLGCGGNMGELLRTRSGNFLLADSHFLSEIKELASVENTLEDINKILIPVDKALNFKKVTIKSWANKFLYNGNKMTSDMVCGNMDNLEVGETVFAIDENSCIIGIYNVLSDDESKYIKPAVMLI